jgi:hypothetical protein
MPEGVKNFAVDHGPCWSVYLHCRISNQKLIPNTKNIFAGAINFFHMYKYFNYEMKIQHMFDNIQKLN